MGQILHGSATTTEAVRRALQHSHPRLQLRTPPKDPQGPHAIRVHLQMLDFRARTVHPQSTPPNAGTEHLTVRQIVTASIRQSFLMEKTTL